MKDVAEYKSVILKTSEKLFFEFGIRRVSIDEICREIHISKRSFYTYFASKEELIDALMQFRFTSTTEKFQKLLRGKNSIETLLLMIREAYNFLDSNKKENVIREDIIRYYPRVFEQFKKTHEKMFREQFNRNLYWGIEEGFYREDLDVEVLSAYHFLHIKDTDKNCKSNEDWTQKFSKKRITDFFVDMFIRFIVNEKGMRYFEENYFKAKSEKCSS
jgi:AcrR family transcriptional regulator